jgi:RHS repeat-associated protein
MPGMYSTSTANYRFGFNGMIRDDDVKEKISTTTKTEGTGNSYDFGARMYDPRVGRWWSMDKITKPFLSSYVFGLNNPIIFVDPDGNDDYYYNDKGNLTGYVENTSRANRIFRQNEIGQYKFDNKNYLVKLITDRNIKIEDPKNILGLVHEVVWGQDEIWLNNGNNKTTEYKINSDGTIGGKSNQIPNDSPVGVIDLYELSKIFSSDNDYNSTMNRTKSKSEISYQGHHIIPKEVADYAVVEAAMRACFKLYSATNNLVDLPTKFTNDENGHYGSHPEYTNFIRRLFNDYQGDSDEKARKFIEEEVIPKALEELNNAVESDKSINDYFRELNR